MSIGVINQDPFSSDFFGREVLSEHLSKIVISRESPLVISLNGAWGEGKTDFSFRWIASLKKHQNVIPIYYDAFSNDFTTDVFISIAVTIQKELTDYFKEKGIDRERKIYLDKLSEFAKEVAFELTKLSATTAVNVLTVNTLSIGDFLTKWKEKARKFDSNKNKELTDEKYESFLKFRDTILQYQNLLETIISQEKGTKIVFIVDELDRCRPNFAVEVIEKIKHLFSIQNVHFLLAINKDQLLSTIKYVYGVSEKNAGIYLQKFIHLEANLPRFCDFDEDNSTALKGYFEALRNDYGIEEGLIDIGLYEALIKQINGPDRIPFVPRSFDKIFGLYQILTYSFEKEKIKKNWKYLILLITLKLEARKIYDKIVQTEIIDDNWWKGEQVEIDLEYDLKGLVVFLKDKFFTVKEYASVTGGAIYFQNLDEIIDIIELFDIPYSEIEAEERKKMDKGKF